MVIAYDILLDNTGDLKVTNGDFEIGESDEQHIQDIILSHKGEWRADPVLGVGISTYINAPRDLSNSNSLRQKIRKNLQYDGYQERKIDVSDFESITIDAERKR